ncbi:hypothetical protein ACQKLP_12940 [Chitinophaga sp. NPDC101104]|uniref:hypothetical protein n=1 Tax=Chitinophaga sp. NPDC101104 TaxID=3390561 RepID=UPI003D070B82
MTLETLLPMKGLALTSGPAQPEMTQFQPAGMSDMVDLFTGDFKYNLPLLDVDGYPVNLSYAQGSGMEDEASWVGLGWNLNIGSVTRQLRGVPDDHNGDKVTTKYHMKKKVTTGAKVSGRLELTGWEVLKVGGSISAGLFYDNYTGYGAEAGYGYNAGLSLSSSNSGSLTVGLRSDVSSNTSSGVSKTLGASLSIGSKMNDYGSNSIGANISQSYNSREGMKSLTLGVSYGNTSGKSGLSSSATFELNTPVFYPSAQIPFKNASHTFSVDLGATAYTVSVAAGFSGYRSTREVKQPEMTHLAYGSLYGANAKNNGDALMDFMREKDNIVVPDMQHIALPVATPDNFTYSSQAGGGQFKVYNGGSGVFFNNRKVDESHNTSFGSDFGVGALFHGGVSLYNQQIDDRSQKWERDNAFLANGDFPEPATVDEEQTYFKSIGENTMEDATFASRINGEEPVRVPIHQKSAGSKLQKTDNNLVPDGKYKRSGRQVRNNTIQYLTASQASRGSLNTRIPNYSILDINTFSTQGPCAQPFDSVNRVGGARMGHHISEISVMGNDGKRLVYGVPVYNNFQTEISFAYKKPEGAPPATRTSNLVTYEKTGGQIKHRHAGTDEYYNEQTQPGYATSYLLSAILSPDYVDVTNNGITEDDRGTAVKFNYSRLSDKFKWRSPMASAPNMATLNQGNLADPDDDKASIVYGEKEIWYLHSIETKTKIAYFITDVREDALGVDGIDGNKSTTVKQRRLREIRLYSKSDLTTPIKTVYLKHNYNLCKGVPNHTGIGGTGKLTLESVHFTYGSSKMGENFPYKFRYNETQDGKGNYEILGADRWGTYKSKDDNPGGMLNDEFAYSRNTKPGLFQLSAIELPTGSTIEIEYEPDSYRFVQNRQAMEMRSWSQVQMLDSNNAVTQDLLEMKQLVMENTANATDLASFREKYLNGGKYLYGKVFVNLTDEPHSDQLDHFDWVPCYAEVTGVQTSGGNIKVSFAGTQVFGNEYNPFAAAAWQRMRLDYPRYAYPGFRNKIPDDQPISAAISALNNAIGNLRELKEDFNEKAVRKRFGNKIKAERSFFRVATAEKQGGGGRVKQLITREVWDGGPEEKSILQYTYTTTAPDGSQVSSGVASYEPSLGGDENPWRLPDPYTQVNRKALNNEYYLEEPFGESLFPAPVVGYSEVKVESRSGREGTGVSQTGYLQHEFYTAKDFPTEVTATGLDRAENQRPALASFFGSKSVYELTMSQGYVIRLNDMHGKPKAERVFNQQRKEISSTEYHYNSEERGGAQRLLNKVDVVDERGVITKNQVISRELDMIVDMREGETNNSGLAINVGADVIPILWFVIPIPHFPITSNSDYRLFRSASVVKTVQYFGVPKKIVKKVDGSEITSTNLLFDKNTGVPVVTSTDNEFNDPVYSVSLPAYWMYAQMGHAYKTADMLLKRMSVDKDGLIDPRYRSFLTPGDEMLDLNGTLQTRYWVISSNIPNDPCPVRLINKYGVMMKSMKGDYKIIRSGNRNLLGAVAGTITCLEKPYTDLRLDFPDNEDLTRLLTLDAKAVLFAEDWGQPPSCKSQACPEGWVLNQDGTRCLEPARMIEGNIGFYNSTSQVAGFQTEYAKRAEFYDDNFFEWRNQGFWAPDNGGRFRKNAIWTKFGDNERWSMLKRKFKVDRSGDFWIGFGGDEWVEVKINNDMIYAEQTLTSNWSVWNMRRIYLHEGYNEITFKLKNKNQDYGGAFEIYDNSREELLTGDPNIIDVVFDSHQAIEDGMPYEAFILDGSKNIQYSLYRCAAGEGLPDYQTDELIPYCNSTAVGECPSGYEKADDGLTCVKRVTKNHSLGIVYRSGHIGLPDVRYVGARIYDEEQMPTNYKMNRQSNYFGLPSGQPPMPLPQIGRLYTAGMWPNTTVQAGGTVQMTFCINLPDPGEYWVGYSSSSNMSFNFNTSYNYGYEGDYPTWTRDSVSWLVQKVPAVQGKNNIWITAKAGNYNWNNFAFEIYRNTEAELMNLSGNDQPNVVFKLSDLMTAASIPYNLSISNSTGSIQQQRYSCNPNVHFNLCFAEDSTLCASMKISEAINPYISGHLGNWLPSEEKVFLTNRKATPKESVDVVRKGGSYARFRPFWQWSAGSQKWVQSTDIDWTTARWITAYDTYSQELENMNALKQYSGTRFGFNGALPLVVGTNAQSRELYAEGFEDYYFNRKCSGFTPCIMDGFDIRRIVGTNFSQWLNADDAHSGNYSLKLSSPIRLTMYAYSETHAPGKYLVRNAKGEYERAPVKELQLFGFNPVPEKEYILSIWMKDNQPRTKSLPVQITVDGTTLSGTWKANVEGWKLAEYTFRKAVYNSTTMQPMELLISGGATTLVDDIRIYPKDGQAVTYAYDDKSLRLMAELDANNFATFYEYDEQGRLIRVKKETEKGILTIKESRSTYIKRNL